MSAIHSKVILVPASVIDRNGHVNNVAFLQWMQDVAVEHYTALGGLEAETPYGTWFAREHRVEYLRPVFLGEEIEIRTWIENVRRVRSLRRYEFVRRTDGELLVRGETDWVFVQPDRGKPCAIPDAVRELFRELP